MSDGETLAVQPLPAPGAGARRRPALRVEPVLLCAALYVALAGNGAFWSAALAGRDLADGRAWALAAALLALLVAGAFLPLAAVATRRTAKPAVALLLVTAAAAGYFVDRYGVYLDPDMLRNALRTDWGEAGELLTPALALHLLVWCGPPLFLLARVELRRPPALRALAVRVGWTLALLATTGGLLFAAYQDLASLLRNQRELRYLAIPGNYLYSGVRMLAGEARQAGAAAPRRPVGEDAVLGPGWAQRTRPALFVLVVGETARAANWQLSGYQRPTTPQLAARGDVIDFGRVSACGTNTEVSLPCMFSAVGRRDYDERRIRGSEGLLHVLARAGFAVRWRDNQSGCKGVCDGLGEERMAAVDAVRAAGLCDGERCLDEALLSGLDSVVEDAAGNLVFVLHMLGNHGPAYFRRYPEAFRQFTPDCRDTDLARCSREEIVNAYDNALRYTDHVLARAIEFLEARAATHDTALLYVSDHGESLGENGLFLHGVPYAIAPRQQTEVPMALWLSPSFAANFGVDAACLRERASRPTAHDHLFHSLLGLLDVRTTVYDAGWDFTAGCRRAG